MAEQRKKSHSILLTINSKVVSLELYDAALWPNVSSSEGLWRVRIDGRWHTSTGNNYCFLTMPAVAELIATLLNGGVAPVPALPPEGFYLKARLRVHYGDCVGGLPIECAQGSLLAMPCIGADGRWWVWVSLYTRSGVRRMMVPVENVEIIRG